MDYFVSANYEPYHQWQIELLIESFKRNNRQDNLIVSLTKMDEEVIHPDFNINILSHKRLIIHDNIGKIRGYNKLNDMYALMWAIKDGHLKQPFITMPIITADPGPGKRKEIKNDYHGNIRTGLRR